MQSVLYNIIKMHIVIGLSIPEELNEIIEKEMGNISKSKFIVRALEKGLGIHKAKREVFTNG